MKFPVKVYIEPGAIEKVFEVIKDRRNILMLTGKNVYDILAKKFEEKLKNSFEVTTFFVERSSVDEVKRIVVNTSYSDFEVVLGFGGGKVIDVAKVTATELNVPFISIPTSASHDGIASPVASFKENGKPISISTNPPSAVLADVKILIKSPRRLMNSGFGDLISNITAVKDWQLAKEKVNENYNEVAASISSMPAELMLKKAEELDFNIPSHVKLLVQGLIMSGVAMAIVGSSRPASGSEHKFSHAVDYLGYGFGLHGEQVGIGTIIMEYFYEKVYGIGEWEKVKRAFEKIGSPSSAREIGLNKEQILEALVFAKRIRRKRYTILEDLNPSKDDFEKAIKETKIV
ncbi:MAG: sn-glycerol-1-phosphate dehydrogenase [Archaeoglobaceae archaeon]|nr:sn-glycerol-1-phosphate dehydrogenase [Archaeoglobaceae archaeon]MCX8151780.1 sn-glycerol-1-phosphate dehydrogenase [Archaeoglobaceae archaeon]MDW8013195.1 sn-glycerol-1-phosphate dehydrogenase [Archaeoglobaceae archaeon]